LKTVFEEWKSKAEKPTGASLTIDSLITAKQVQSTELDPIHLDPESFEPFNNEMDPSLSWGDSDGSVGVLQ